MLGESILPGGQRPSWFWPALTIAVCALLTGVMRVSIDSYAMFLLPLSNELEWDRGQAGSLYGLTMLSFGLGCPLAGRLMDRLGPAWTYTIGLVAIAIAFFFASRIDCRFQFMLTIGVLVGFGAALIGMVSHSWLLAHWYKDRLTMAISIATAASGVSILIVAPIIQSFIDMIGWRNVYYWMGIVVLGFAFAIPLLPWKALRPAREIDYAADHSSAQGKPFSWLMELIRDHRFLVLFGIQFLTAIGMFSLNPQTVAFLVEQGFDPIFAASVFGAAGLAGSIGLIAFGWLTDRYGRFAGMTLSYLLSFTGLSFLLAILIMPSWWLLLGYILVFGPTFGSRGPILNAMVPSILGRGPRMGLIMGFVQLGMGSGAAVGATMGGFLRDYSGYGAVIAFAMAALAAALFLYLSVGSVRRA